jgi:hypothetical protein
VRAGAHLDKFRRAASVQFALQIAGGMGESGSPKSGRRRPVPPVDRVRLGDALRAIRIAARKTTRQVDGFSTSHVSNVENGHVLPSEDLVATYVRMGGESGRLLALLERARRARGLSTGDEAPWTELLADPNTDPHVLRRGYAIEKIADTYILGSEGQAIANTHRVTIRPLFDGARYFPFRHAYGEDPRRGVSVVEPGPGCSMPILEESDNGTIYAVIGFEPSTSSSDGARHLEWTIRFDTSVRARPQVSAGTSSPVTRASVRVNFNASLLPNAVWWFRAADPLAGDMSAPDRNHFPVGGSEGYERTFHNLDHEWWGLGWSWRAD